MSTQLEINGISFLPIKEAAKVVSYSRDYVAKLAREEKIVASQIGRQWYVDLLSLKNFAEASSLEQEVRKQKLSNERKREQLLKAEVLEIRKSVIKKTKRARHEARAVATLVLCLGLLSGVGFNTAQNFVAELDLDFDFINKSQPQLTNLQSDQNDLLVNEVVKPMPTALYTTVASQPLFVDESEVKALSVGNKEGIFLLAKDSTVEDGEAVSQLFSDKVEVVFTKGSTGMVSYTRADGSRVDYDFVSVPSGSDTDRTLIQ